MKKSTRIALAAAGAFLLAACSGGGDASPDGSASSSAPKMVAELPAVVDTSLSECRPETAAEDGNCWLPLYAGSGVKTRAVNLGGSCTRSDERTCWPQPGDRLTVVCGEPNGEGASDNSGYYTEVWLGVAIPKSRVVASGYSPELDQKGRAIVFVSSLWLKPLSNDRFKFCSSLFVETNEL